MKEDKLSELGAKDPLFIHPYLECFWQTVIGFLPLITPEDKCFNYVNYSCILELVRPLVFISETT
jgi:hypothetical protein